MGFRQAAMLREVYTLQMNEFHAWAAGLYEGEGNVGISISIARRNYRVMRASVSNTHIDLLEPLREAFGGSIHAQRSKREKPCYLWTISDRGALRFIDTILPFVRSRRRRITLKIAKKFQMLRYEPDRIEYRISKGGIMRRRVRQHFINEELTLRSKLMLLNSGKVAA